MPTHIEDFATQLRELKERSGRSYGQLATRLHVSTSTLHRYCNGAAVPTEYAPVERLARVCGATPEELVTLHRRWLLADAQRREPEREPEPVVADRVPPEAPEPPDAPEAPARRSRRTVLVLGAVAAIAAVTALPLALRTEGGDTQNTGASAPLTTHSTTGTPGAPSTPSGTPTGGTGSPAPSPSGSGGSSGSATASPSAASSSPAAGDDGPPPLQVNVLADNWDMQCGQWFLMSQQPGKVPPPPSLEQTNAWASALGGVPGGHLRLQLTVQGRPGQPVVLHALYVHVVSSRPAASGIAYTAGSGCGGGLDPASFAVDLDATVPRTKPVAGYVGSSETSTLSNFPYQVSSGDAQVLNVDAGTVGQDVSWYLGLAWSSGDRSGVLPIDDHGRPFRTVGLQGDPAYFYDGTAWSRTSVQN
ncbi:helix-turn-helix domain-containing protein [Streptacidiphilus pinicola]|nr:helix-turn-helix transcriptional regulator [Streptacidiphilus pinicola]